ncbi:hypothetical protein [Rhodococcus koreensis]
MGTDRRRFGEDAYLDFAGAELGEQVAIDLRAERLLSADTGSSESGIQPHAAGKNRAYSCEL